MAIIKQTFEQQGIGTLVTLPGAAGGVKYIPKMTNEEASQLIQELCGLIEKPERLLPGGYLYLTDILGNPRVVNKIGRLYASAFC